MQPPINELPEGEWYCPPCQNAAAQHYFSRPPPEIFTEDHHIPLVPPLPFESNREHSVASSSRSDPPMPVTKTRGRRRKNPKRISTPVVNGETGIGEDADVDVGGTPGPPAPRVQPRKRGRPPKYRPPPKVEVTEEDAEGETEGVEQVDIEEEDAGDEVEATPIQPRTSRKRKRERELDSSPTIPRVRLRLPTTRNSVKGKEKEEAEMLGGIFDGVLNLEDGDTSKTTIVNHDKQLFERSRMEAEVRRCLILTFLPLYNSWTEKTCATIASSLRHQYNIQQRSQSILDICFGHIHY